MGLTWFGRLLRWIAIHGLKKSGMTDEQIRDMETRQKAARAARDLADAIRARRY